MPELWPGHAQSHPGHGQVQRHDSLLCSGNACCSRHSQRLHQSAFCLPQVSALRRPHPASQGCVSWHVLSSEPLTSTVSQCAPSAQGQAWDALLACLLAGIFLAVLMSVRPPDLEGSANASK